MWQKAQGFNQKSRRETLGLQWKEKSLGDFKAATEKRVPFLIQAMVLHLFR